LANGYRSKIEFTQLCLKYIVSYLDQVRQSESFKALTTEEFNKITSLLSPENRTMFENYRQIVLSNVETGTTEEEEGESTRIKPKPKQTKKKKGKRF